MAALTAGYRRATPPADVHRAFLAFTCYLVVGLVAGLTGLLFTAFALTSVPGNPVAAVGGSVVGMLLTAILYGVGLFAMVWMRAGQSWARRVLAVLAGSGLVVAGLGVVGLLTSLDATVALYGAARVGLGLSFALVQVATLLAGLWWMYRPRVASHFR